MSYLSILQPDGSRKLTFFPEKGDAKLAVGSVNTSDLSKILTKLPDPVTHLTLLEAINKSRTVTQGGGTFKPAILTIPAITGIAQEGKVLSVNNGIWSGNPTSFTYQWKRNGSNISGSINATRILVAEDVGKTMTCQVSALNSAGTGSASSGGTVAVVAADVPVPVNTALPEITGSSSIGSVLSVSNGTWTNSPTSYQYQWRRDGVNILGATNPTYTVTNDDAGKVLSARVTAVNAGGNTPSVATNTGSTPVPTLSISSVAPKPEGNTGTTAFTFILTLARDGSTSVYPFNWSVAGFGGSPANAADFGGTLPSGSGSFAANETTKTITVLASGDTAVEPDEAFSLTVNAAGLNTVVTNSGLTNDDTSSGATPYTPVNTTPGLSVFPSSGPIASA